MNTLSYNVNNNNTMKLVQHEHDGSVSIIKEDSKGNRENILDAEAFISTGDMIMLVNYYRYIKRNDIKNDFINPNGKNNE